MNLFLRLSFTFFAFGLLAFSSQAFALCVAQDMAGNWTNEDNQTRGITKVIINFACNDTIHNGVRRNDPDTIQVWGSCTPSDCKWDENILVNRFWDGRRSQYTYAEVIYRKNYATTKLKVYLINKNRLQIVSLTDFSANNRPDYSSIYYFRK